MSSGALRRAWYFIGMVAGLVGLICVDRHRHRGLSGGSPAANTSESQPTTSSSAMEEDRAPERAEETGVIALLGEMVDLLRVSQLPEPAYTSHLASSYDRRSLSPDDSTGWFANSDWASRTDPNFIATQAVAGRREYVLLDARGPGAIVRIWSATPTGTLRLYVDGKQSPVLEANMGELLSGRWAIPAPFSYVAALGYNLYFPFPFRSSCRLTVDSLVATDPFRGGPLEKFYYQVNYRLYSPESAGRIRSFSRSDLALASPVISRVAAVLARPPAVYQATPEHLEVPFLGQGDEAQATVTRAGGVVRELRLKVGDKPAASLSRATITVRCDDQVTVDLPLADFFGAGREPSSYESLPFTVADDGTLISRWPMPFRQRATVSVRGSAAISGQLSVEPFTWTDRSLYFGARRKAESQIRTRPIRDLELASLKGSGIYVGTSLDFANPPGAMWWGEGDEKVYVDQEPFPSLFGTGTEDYFGFAWSTTERFVRSFHAQTRAGSSGFGGQFTMNRFHILDAIPFRNGLRFDLELWHWEDTNVSYAATAYFYARPRARDKGSVPGRSSP